MHHVEVMANEVCRFIVAMERLMSRGASSQTGASWSLDTPGLGVLLSLDLFGALRPGVIGDLLGMTSGGTSKLVSRLEDEGFVVRAVPVDTADRRAVEVRITDEGREVVRACERIAVLLADDLMHALDRVLTADDVGSPVSAPVPAEPPAGPATGSVLAQLFRFVNLADLAVLGVVGEIEVLQPEDPRGLLVLLELDLRGPLRVGEVASLVGRSRAAAHGLVSELERVGLVGREREPEDRRGVIVTLTPVGRAVLRGVVAALTASLPNLRPAMTDLALELGHIRT